MSRSYHFGRWTLPETMARSLTEALGGCDGCSGLLRGYCLDHRHACSPVGDAPLAAELRRRGWPGRRIRALLHMHHGGWARKDDTDDRRLYQRRYRSRTRQVLRAGGDDVELEPWRPTRGWLSW